MNRCVDNFFAETEQVAFCTQNIVPGIDFSNDPLLQGRNFSYLDTQIKRLGSPNFTHLPINAPKCPMHLFQQDGHMAMTNPKGRVNYEPNSWKQGPRENPVQGFHSYPEDLTGTKQRVRSETFLDHYSQARQFFLSQSSIEQHHIAEALTFELSKVMTLAIRERMVGHLLNIDKELAQQVAAGLNLKAMPAPAPLPIPVNTKLKKSPALSIALNPPKTFEGRKLGLFITDGADSKIFNVLKQAVADAGANLEIIAPSVGGVTLSDGSHLVADQNIKGAPAVLYDAVILMFAKKIDKKLLQEPTLRDFACDAFAHFKFIGYVPAAAQLFEKIGIYDDFDAGCIEINNAAGVKKFLAKCKDLRFWPRQVKLL